MLFPCRSLGLCCLYVWVKLFRELGGYWDYHEGWDCVVLNSVHLISFLVANHYEWPCVEYIHVIPCIKYWNRVIKSILQHWVGINSLLCYSIESLMQGIIFRTKYTHWTCKIDFTCQWIIIAFLVHRTFLFILKYCWL